MDYCGYSLPLIFMALLAAGLAISMLTADVLVKTDVKQQVVDVRPQTPPVGRRNVSPPWLSLPPPGPRCL